MIKKKPKTLIDFQEYAQSEFGKLSDFFSYESLRVDDNKFVKIKYTKIPETHMQINVIFGEYTRKNGILNMIESDRWILNLHYGQLSKEIVNIQDELAELDSNVDFGNILFIMFDKGLLNYSNENSE